MANLTNPSESRTNWRYVGLGVFLIFVGIAGVAVAWFPAPPHSTAAPLAGWPARWFAVGVGFFGLLVAVVGAANGRQGDCVSRTLRQAGRGSLLLALVCFAGWAVALLLGK